MKPFLGIVLLGLLLGNYSGRIALWSSEQSVPEIVFPYPVASLPSEDQKLLSDGIPIENFRELADLLQDYLS